MATLAFPQPRRGTDSPAAGLLPTKLHRPRLRPALVARLRLSERIEAGLWRSLTLISAPAGSGKTTLLAQWLAHTRVPVGWLALDEADNQPNRFIQYLVAALHQAIPSLEGSVDPLFQSAGAADPEQLLAATVVAPLADNRQILVLVLDDYHVIHNSAIHHALAWLLDHRPPGLHLIITTRHDPPLPLARLRVRDELNEIRAADLRFNRSEAGRFFHDSMRLALSEADIDLIEHRTEGWVAALQLSALSLRGREDRGRLLEALRGDHHLIADYLIQEVLDRQPPERRRFLLRTAVLERLCGPLCAVLTGRDDAQALLESLDAANLFLIPLDEQRRWYRYHHLFAELLRRRLEQELPGEAADLHRRASHWYREAGLVHEAVEHARKAGDRELLIELLESAGETLIKRGETETLRDWLSGLPDPVYRQQPRLAMLEGWCASTGGDYPRASRVVELGRQGLAENNALPTAERLTLAGHFTAIRSFVASSTGDPGHGLELAQQAMTQLPDEETLVRSVMALSIGNNHALAGRLAAADQPLLIATRTGQASGNYYVAAVAYWFQGQIAIARGQLDQATAHAEQNQRLLDEAHCAHLPLSGFVAASRCRLAYERLDLDEAGRWAEQTLRQANLLKDIGFSIIARILHSQVLIASGQADAARGPLTEALARAESGAWPDYWGELPAIRARLALTSGDLAGCRALLGGTRLLQSAHTTTVHAGNLMRVRLALEEQRAGELLKPLMALIAATEAEKLHGNALELRVLAAATLLQTGKTDAALDLLRQVLQAARAQRWRRPCVELAARLAPLAERLNAGERDFIGIDGARENGLIEPLSAREQEVLELLARGLSNQAIAEQLFVSVGTVKTHVHNLLGKFQVGNRTGAVHRARGLGLLPDD